MVLDIIGKRWSPRALSSKIIEKEKIDALFEAAKWAPSSMNEQPWLYFYAPNDKPELFNSFADCLVPGNKVWAKECGLLILSVAKKRFAYKNHPNRHYMHDVGAANALLALQAAGMGLQVHQMGGFDMTKTLKTFNLDPEKFEPATFMAVAYPGDPDNLPEDMKKRELSPRVRNSISSFVNNKID